MNWIGLAEKIKERQRCLLLRYCSVGWQGATAMKQATQSRTISEDISQSMPSDESKIPNSSEQVVKSANYGDDNAENGPFISEEDYNEMCQNIVIGEKKISFPCTVSELNPEFTLGGVPVIQKDLRLATFLLMYGSEDIGTCTVRYGLDLDFSKDDNVEKLSDCILTGISFRSNSYLTPVFGELSFKTDMKTVLSKLGEPTERFDNDDGTCMFNYCVKDNTVTEKSIMLIFDDNHQIYDVGFCWE